MERVTVDNSLRSVLHDFRLPLELCDASGRILGYLTPATDPGDYEGIDSPTSPEELRRRSEARGGRPLAGILRDLEQGG